MGFVFAQFLLGVTVTSWRIGAVAEEHVSLPNDQGHYTLAVDARASSSQAGLRTTTNDTFPVAELPVTNVNVGKGRQRRTSECTLCEIGSSNADCGSCQAMYAQLCRQVFESTENPLRGVSLSDGLSCPPTDTAACMSWTGWGMCHDCSNGRFGYLEVRVVCTQRALQLTAVCPQN